MLQKSITGSMGQEKFTAYKNDWIAEKLDRINLTVPKGMKEKIKEHAKSKGMSVNQFINVAINEKMGLTK